MAKQSLTIPINRDIGIQAQAVFNDMAEGIILAFNVGGSQNHLKNLPAAHLNPLFLGLLVRVFAQVICD